MARSPRDRRSRADEGLAVADESGQGLEEDRGERYGREQCRAAQREAKEEDEGDHHRKEDGAELADEIGPPEQNAGAGNEERRHPAPARDVLVPTGEQEAEDGGRERRRRREVREDVAGVDQVVDVEAGHERRCRREHAVAEEEEHRREHGPDQGQAGHDRHGVERGLGRPEGEDRQAHQREEADPQSE
jgi:hypothetical protein